MKYLKVILFCICFFSCELSPPPPDCIETSIITDLDPNSNAYQSLVMSILESTTSSDYRYFFKTFEVNGSKTYMILNFRNESACFDAKMLVERWDKLEGMLKVNGKSYPKELINLKWKIEINNEVKTVVYRDMDWIID